MPDPDPVSPAEGTTDAAFVEVVPGPRVEGTIRPPGSKSLTNRALTCAAFARGKSVLSGALRSEDTEVMIDALRAVGVTIDVSDDGRQLVIDGFLPMPAASDMNPLDLYVANSGTTIRFLTAALSAAGGNYRLHGVARMHQRPIIDLVRAIDGVMEGRIWCESEGGCPPVRIQSRGWKRAELSVAGSVSSQYLSGLMMAAPVSQATAKAGRANVARIHVTGELVSRPYVTMTTQVMNAFGADVQMIDETHDSEATLRFDVSSEGYRGTEYSVEPDASAASYFWAAAAITGGSVTVEGLSADAMQGDVGFCEVLQSMGCHVDYRDDSITVAGAPLYGVDVDMNSISDTVQTLAVVALFAKGPTRVRGVAHNRFKETDRIGDLARELRKLGATVDEHPDGLTIAPPSDRLHAATLETYDDHRMAMSLSLAGLKVPGIRILNPACTSKTYPEFFADLERLIGRAHRWA
jgi:3-phosphoshikimate 1-carboxyvinyltransferase